MKPERRDSEYRPPSAYAAAPRDGATRLPTYDPAATLASIRAAGGSWSDLDAEALKADLYRAREEGTRPPDHERTAIEKQ